MPARTTTPPTLWGREPALILGAVSAALAVAVGFGLPVTPEQVGLIMAAVTALVALAVRTQVTPAAMTVERVTDDGQVIAGPANDQVTPGALVRRISDDAPDGQVHYRGEGHDPNLRA